MGKSAAVSSQTKSQTAQLKLPNATVSLPVIVGTENEHAVDIAALRNQSGYITLDSGYANTGSCTSAITYIDGETGILRYRGISIEQIAEHSTFIETAWLLIWGELPTRSELDAFSSMLTEHALLHEGLRHHFEGFPPEAAPMAILSAMINACSCYHPELLGMEDEEMFVAAVAKLLSKVRTIAAFSFKKSIGQPVVYPDPTLRYCSNLLHMMFSLPYQPYELDTDVVRALNLVMMLHADHEQNCSTATVRMVGSSQANLFGSVAAGVCALWGPLHGGANIAVVEMLEQIRADGGDVSKRVELVKGGDVRQRLMGFGHRVYKNYDPRAKILKAAADKVLAKLGIDDPLLDIAKQLEEVAMNDDYFIERKLYPNVDFYSGIILRAIGVPVSMFTVMFAIGRMPGWIANWREVHLDPGARIYRPRQIYTGPNERTYVPVDKRG